MTTTLLNTTLVLLIVLIGWLIMALIINEIRRKQELIELNKDIESMINGLCDDMDGMLDKFEEEEKEKKNS